MARRRYPKPFLDRLRAVTSKRPRTVIEHILEHGFITTEELATKYGYKHPPRAARDVREQGIPLETFRVKNSEGRTIAAYRFGNPTEARSDRAGGRRVFSKVFKDRLVHQTGSRCSICLERYEDRYLQVDHRVPYEVTGDAGGEKSLQEYMLVCGSCNRAKSWSCEHCINWLEGKVPIICHACYWAHPESYIHIALRAVRRLDVVWTEQEVDEYERLKRRAEVTGQEMPVYVKAVIRDHLEETT